jgi:hypothetical protein
MRAAAAMRWLVTWLNSAPVDETGHNSSTQARLSAVVSLASRKMHRDMTYLRAAIAVLRSMKRPMTVNEITATAVARGLIQPAGKTPGATMSAALYTYIRDDQDPEIVRLFEPGIERAQRGSVRWAFRSMTTARRSRRGQ